jgi:ribosome-associated protein
MPEAKPSTVKAQTSPPSLASADPSIVEWVRHAVDAAVDKQAFDLKVLHLGAVTDFTDFFFVATGRNDRQVGAITEAILRALRAQKVRPLHVEGANKGQWVLLDYGDFVCHIFDEERRAYYALERLWSDAPDVTAHFASREAGGESGSAKGKA